MIRVGLLLLVWLVVSVSAHANPCEDAGHDAEQAAGLPTDLLVAIGRIETGRRGADGRASPWPWSVNAAGEGYFLQSAAEAVALVRTLQARGIRSIDVGCFQMNLLYHPNAFASLEDAFDPAANARAAASFLSTLYAGVPVWGEAVGRYHSADPARGQPYSEQVMASWRGGASAKAPALSQVAALVRVITPGGGAPGLVRSFGRGLPVVILPSGLRS